MAVYYPTLVSPDVGSSIKHTLEVITTGTDSPVGFIRRKFSKESTGFILNYSNITKEQFSTLLSFFNDNQGTKFKYVHTDVLGSTEYWCIFAMDSLKVSYGRGNLRNTSIQLVTV